MLDELLDELELLPHAASPSASNATPASAPILFLVTTSPLAGLRVEGRRVAVTLAGTVLRGSLLSAGAADVNIS